MNLRPHRAPPLWSIVLAAGQGKRLADITRALCGRWLPKQFVALTSKRTLLQETLERTRPLVPPVRTVIVISEPDEDIARRQLAAYPGIEIVRQPTDRGTAAGLMLGLAHVRAREPRADVAVFPADHHVEDPAAWSAAVEDARAASRIAPSGVALLGAPADRPASDLGWILPGLGLPDVGDGRPRNDLAACVRTASLVQEFVEKPPQSKASQLLAAGGLWNTMVVVGRVSALWRLGWCHVPGQMHHFERYVRALHGQRAYRMLTLRYQRMPAADLSRDILQAAPGLAVVPVTGSGWFDCGTPERLLAWLTATADPSGVLARIGPQLQNGRGEADPLEQTAGVSAFSA